MTQPRLFEKEKMFEPDIGIVSKDDLHVEIISNNVGMNFCELYHNLHDRFRANFWLGLKYDTLILGVCAFTMGPFPNFGKLMSKGMYGNNQVLCLKRFCCSDSSPKFTESIFLGKIIKFFKHHKKDIKLLVTYVTASQGEVGTAWQATNWIYIGTTKARTGNLLHRYIYPLINNDKKHLLVKWSDNIKDYPKKELICQKLL